MKAGRVEYIGVPQTPIKINVLDVSGFQNRLRKIFLTHASLLSRRVGTDEWYKLC